MANDVASDGYQGRANETTGAEEYNTLSFLINQIISGKWTVTLAQVKGVTGGGPTAKPGTVNVQPLVNQVDGQGNATAHGVINNVPVLRLQGGTAAMVIDPIVGDIGLIACASRDISSVTKNAKVSNPGSGRTFDPADALYLGGFLNKAPTQYIQLSSDGIVLQFSSTVSVKINGDGITLTAGSASIVVSNGGHIQLNGKDWDVHTHFVTAINSQTGTPVN